MLSCCLVCLRAVRPARAALAHVKVLGSDHPDTLEAANNLAHALYGQSKHDEAATVLTEVVAAQK
jgi:DNA helicase TIP49 (TBP-interacting protein)